MATDQRLRSDGQSGTITDSPLGSGATTINSAGFANLPVVTPGTDHLVIVLDPAELAGELEIVHVTTHTASATSVTVSRGQEGSSARSHNSGTIWRHGPVVSDYMAQVTSSTRPTGGAAYRGRLIFEHDTDKFVARSVSDVWQEVVNLGAWSAYTPTVTQSGAVTMTVVWARWTRIGRTVHFVFRLTSTGAGTAGNEVLVSVPVTAADAQGMQGSGLIIDASTATSYTGTWNGSSTTTVRLLNDLSAATGGWGAAPSIALASGDTIRGSVTYEAAS